MATTAPKEKKMGRILVKTKSLHEQMYTDTCIVSRNWSKATDASEIIIVVTINAMQHVFSTLSLVYHSSSYHFSFSLPPTHLSCHRIQQCTSCNHKNKLVDVRSSFTNNDILANSIHMKPRISNDNRPNKICHALGMHNKSDFPNSS